MKTANVHEAKTTLSRLLDAAAAGEDVFIVRNGTRFRLSPVVPDRSALFGALAGYEFDEDAFRAADVELEEMFYGAPGDFADDG